MKPVFSSVVGVTATDAAGLSAQHLFTVTIPNLAPSARDGRGVRPRPSS